MATDKMAHFVTIFWLLILCSLSDAFVLAPRSLDSSRIPLLKLWWSSSGEDNKASSKSTSSAPISSPPLPPPPVLNGQRILPTKVLLAGLQGHTIAAVYAVLGASYQRGSDGWESVQYVGITKDLTDTIRTHAQEHDASQVAHVRALSFTYPQPSAMQAVAAQWRDKAVTAGANLDQQELWTRNVLEYVSESDDGDDEDDDDDDDWLPGMTAEAMATVVETNNPVSSRSIDESSVESESEMTSVVSPFADQPSQAEVSDTPTNPPSSLGRLPLNVENIDQVLDEVRPYLIADGGNVAVSRIDADSKTVYLELQGACGSCPSSTVTMQMGIERVLKENFDVEHVLSVDSPGPTELTWEAVEKEVNRIRPAIMAMGGVCDLVSVDATTGVVQIKFRGFNKVQQGLELALLDVPFVNAVQFVMGSDDA